MKETRFGVAAPEVMSSTTAFLKLRSLDEEHKKGGGRDGYKPFRVYGHESGVVTVGCSPDDAGDVRTFLEQYLSEEDGRMRRIVSGL